MFPKKLLLKFHQNQVINSGDIPDVDKLCQDKCCMDKCHHDLGYVRLSCGWVGVLTEIIRGCQKALGSVKFLLFG